MTEDTTEQQPAEIIEDAPEAETEVSENTEIAELQAQIADLEDRLKRSFAEQQNQRQRMLKDKANADRYAGAKLAGDLLEVMDNLERAVSSVPISLADNEHVSNLTTGVQLVLEQMTQVLATHSIRKISPMGEMVNYEFHETVAEVDDNPAAPKHVIDVLQPGYVMHDRLLRPAKVVISSGRMRDDNADADPVDQKI